MGARRRCRPCPTPRAASGHPVGPYLELLSSDDPPKGAITPPYRPRYSTGYFALRNRPSILIETHSHKPYRTRVLANHAWMVALLERESRATPRALVEAVSIAEKRTVALGAADAAPSDAVLRLGPDRDDPAAGGGAPDRVRIPLYAWSTRDLDRHRRAAHDLRARDAAGDRPALVPHAARHADRVRVRAATSCCRAGPRIERRLRAHGLRVETLAARRGRRGRDHPRRGRAVRERAVPGRDARDGDEGERARRRRGAFPAGALWVPADQPDFEVAVHLLEPDAPDSLLAWGFLSGIFERKEWIDGPELERMATELLKDPKLAAEWKAALADPAFAERRGRALPVVVAPHARTGTRRSA